MYAGQQRGSRRGGRSTAWSAGAGPSAAAQRQTTAEFPMHAEVVAVRVQSERVTSPRL